jgi:hypothetical protein
LTVLLIPRTLNLKVYLQRSNEQKKRPKNVFFLHPLEADIMEIANAERDRA